ncbi:MAG: hypothetical protein M3Q76_12360, partial [Acidobacteriota bacterium]|nr:hypothetical protein [Acidobacteriota bacterium]
DQVGLGDLVYIDMNEGKSKLIFSKRAGGALINEEPRDEENATAEAKSDGVGLPIPQTKVARKSQGRGEKAETQN